MYANVFISIIVNMQNMYTFFNEAHTYHYKRIVYLLRQKNRGKIQIRTWGVSVTLMPTPPEPQIGSTLRILATNPLWLLVESLKGKKNQNKLCFFKGNFKKFGLVIYFPQDINNLIIIWIFTPESLIQIRPVAKMDSFNNQVEIQNDNESARRHICEICD